MITKSPEDPSNCTLNLIFTQNARAAWGHILLAFRAVAQPCVLLPSYIGYTEREGSGVFDAVQANLADYQFYKLDESLRIDLDEFESALRPGNVNIALVIHYFGFCRNDMESIKQICRDYNVVLVEDCAHAFQLGVKQRLGNYGDFSFYSLHKYLATKSGGLLRINSNVIDIPPLPAAKGISHAVLEQYLKTDVEKVSSVRRSNFASYQQFLPKRRDLELMFDLMDGDIPQSFPLRIKQSQRERLYFYLMERAIPTTALYYRLIEQIKPDKFPTSFEISSEILNLPVHQDITQGDVVRICAAIGEFCDQST